MNTIKITSSSGKLTIKIFASKLWKVLCKINSILKFDPRLHKSQPSLGSRTSAYFLICHACKLFFTFSYMTTRLLFHKFHNFPMKFEFFTRNDHCFSFVVETQS